MRLKVVFCDREEKTFRALSQEFQDVAAVSVVQGNILDLDCQALISPCNSFADMDGGLDKAIEDASKGKAQTLAKQYLAENWYGEMPVGVAAILKFDLKRFRYLVLAPTMRIPGNVSTTLNAYFATRALLVALLQHNQDDLEPIQSVALPGLCTGIGGMAPQQSARQVRAAFDNILGNGWTRVKHSALAPFAFRGGSLRPTPEPESPGMAP